MLSSDFFSHEFLQVMSSNRRKPRRQLYNTLMRSLNDIELLDKNCKTALNDLKVQYLLKKRRIKTAQQLSRENMELYLRQEVMRSTGRGRKERNGKNDCLSIAYDSYVGQMLASHVQWQENFEREQYFKLENTCFSCIQQNSDLKS